MGSGIGGKTALLEIDGTPVFVRRVPLLQRQSRRTPYPVEGIRKLGDTTRRRADRPRMG
jgi:hypothetical protein